MKYSPSFLIFKQQKKMKLITCIFYLCLGSYCAYVKDDLSIIWFTLASIMAVLHFHILIKEQFKQQDK